jgi:hypothetical protein
MQVTEDFVKKILVEGEGEEGGSLDAAGSLGEGNEASSKPNVQVISAESALLFRTVPDITVLVYVCY